LHYNLISIFLIFNIIFSDSNLEKYLWPTDASETITTVFGDKRSRRFHAGIDVRTYGDIGDNLYAIESGYISRISISPTGYGKALYLKLEDGNTAVYAHIDKYENKIRAFIENYKNKNDINFFDIYLKKNDIKINKGDIIGFAGDTGSLSGGHLHFEIRDSEGHPLNPLEKFYTIEDTKKPIPRSIAFIPIDSSCYIDGQQNYMIYEVFKHDSLNYILKDTISVIGNFGLGIEVDDEINNQPFSYGIFNIKAFINDREIYDITFDKYDMKHDHHIYNEIDYNLLTKFSRKFHRLYINGNRDLNFIKNHNYSSFNIDEDFHKLEILVSDNNNNQIKIHGIIKGDILPNPNIAIIKNNDDIFLKSDDNLNKYSLYLTTRYENGIKGSLKYEAIDSNIYYISNNPPPFEIIEYSIKDKGIKSATKYISINDIDINKISGKFNLISYDNGIIIQFIEDFYSGYNSELKLLYADGQEKILNSYRTSKTVISSNLLDFRHLNFVERVILTYDTKPQVQFNYKLNGIYSEKNKFSYLTHKNFTMNYSPNSHYNDLFIWSADTSITINKYITLESPVTFNPTNIPFQNGSSLFYESFEDEELNFGLYNWNGKDWVFHDKSQNNKVKTNLFSGGTYAVLSESEKPIIKNIIPANSGTYKQNDLKEITFNCYDPLSGIDYKSIEISINGIKYYYDFIKYRKLVRANISNALDKGAHTLKISAKDNLNNEKNISYNFFIK